MKILIADTLSDQALLSLQQLGLDADVRPDLSADDLPAAIADFKVLVVRSTRVTAHTIAAASGLSLIVRAGAGVNTIDVQAASDRGIYVANCPGRNSDAVAELVIGLLIACDRHIADAAIDLRSGRWNKKKYSQARGLKGRTLGILGLGRIGQAVARRAKGLEMKVTAWSRSLTPELAEQLGLQFSASPRALAEISDAVTIHLPATEETTGLVDAAFLDALRDGAILINTSRGDLVDMAALKRAIRAKHVRVGLDVFAEEPAAGDAEFPDVELAHMITGTPHIGASTDQAAEAIAAEVVEIINAFRGTGHPLNVVNMCGKTPATHSLVVRHYNRIGVLAGVLDSLREEGINVEEMENTIFAGASAACCTLQLDEPPTPELIEALSRSENVIQVHLEAR